MGFPTPFPEPDSLELQRFALSSLSEIVSRLRTLKAAAVPLNAYVGGGVPLAVVTLQDVDEVAGKLVFEGPADKHLREQLLNSPHANFVCFDEAGKVQFAAATLPDRIGDREFVTLMPNQLFSLHRRSAARMRLQSARTAVCRIPLPGIAGKWETLRLLDISTGGIAVLTHPARIELTVGAEIHGCRLDLPGVGGAVVSLRVRRVWDEGGDGAALRCGCEFARIQPAFRALLARQTEMCADAKNVTKESDVAKRVEGTKKNRA
jgi:c-di-GMP-binding flagellar brake protein YcgR